MSTCKVIGIAGGSCSGKTSFSRQIRSTLGEENCNILFQDYYYIDQSSKFDKDGGAVNFDHPSALDFDLLAKHIEQLKNGFSVDVPIYDFATHSRKPETLNFEPSKVVLLDGILILSQPSIVDLLDDSFFIECDMELRFERRLNRDVVERGRTPNGVKDQFEKQVEPMHQEFVEPSKVYANNVISQANYLSSCSEIIRKHIKCHLK